MKKIHISFLMIGLILLFSACTTAKDNNKKTPNVLNKDTTEEKALIGGDKDSHGCLIAAGYSWCELKEKCLRYWEEPCISEEEKNAVEEYLRNNISELSAQKEVLGGKFYITNIKFTAPGNVSVDYEDGHIALAAEASYEYKKGMVSVLSFDTKDDVPAIDVPGLDNLASSSPALDLLRALSASVLQLSKEIDGNRVLVKWNNKGKAEEYSGYGIVYGGDGGSRDVFEMHLSVLEELKNMGFISDQYNASSGTSELDISRMKKDNIVCNVIKTESAGTNSSELALRCADLE